MAHHVVDVVEAEVIHVLAGHHGDRLRRLARGQYQSCGGGNGAGGVGAALFGDGTQLVAGDLGGAEVDRTRLAHFPYQAVTPVRFLDHRQALAGEQGAQALLDPILAMQAFAALALGQRRVKRQHHSRLGGKTGQHLAKIVLPQVVAARGRCSRATTARNSAGRGESGGFSFDAFSSGWHSGSGPAFHKSNDKTN
ncbi:hypothetical protein D3C76_1081460 [compost metagenome]